MNTLPDHHFKRICFSWLYLFLVGIPIAAAQDFNSGSDESDGALTFSAEDPQPILFNPAELGIDTDGNGVYNFTTITIPAGVAVRLKDDILGTNPVVWLATGNVSIEGDIDLNGKDGHQWDEVHLSAEAGAGGFRGGIGRSVVNRATPGNGPGGGLPGTANPGAGSDPYHGGGAGHAAIGNNGSISGTNGGQAYGNNFLLPLLGGSGGAGGGESAGTGNQGGGGGSGGGAMLIASSSVIEINGSISANGGTGGPGQDQRGGGGGGSGGSLRLLATTIRGNGTIQAKGTSSNPGGGNGSRGRIRIEAFDNEMSTSANIDPQAFFVTPGIIFPPSNSPSIRVISINDMDVPENSRGGFTPADLKINEGDPVDIIVQAKNIPIDGISNTTVKLSMISETGGFKEITVPPLEGTFEESTATANETIPHGFSRFTIEASWDPAN